MLRAEHKTKNKPNQTPALSVLNCHSNAVISFAMLRGVHSGVKSIGLSIRRDLGDLPHLGMGGIGLYHTVFLSHTQFAGTKSTNAREFNLYMSKRKKKLICKASAQPVQN